MKNKKSKYLAIALIVGLILGYGLKQTMEKNSPQETNNYLNKLGQIQNDNPNKNNCLADDCLLVDELEYPVSELSKEVQTALDEAINDEYKALTVYQAVIAKFGTIRPFSMIKGAEEQHIASLKAIYDKYGIEIPENNWSEKITIPSTIKESCQIGVDAEIANAALYRDILIPAVSDYEDISAVFESLMNASEQKHLPSFEKCN